MCGPPGSYVSSLPRNPSDSLTDTLLSLHPCRFLGALTARVGLVQLSDGHVSDPAAVYSPGQTVRAKVVGVDAASGHVSAELKQSTCASAHAEYLASYFK